MDKNSQNPDKNSIKAKNANKSTIIWYCRNYGEDIIGEVWQEVKNEEDTIYADNT